jgi:hypothetical protein
MTSEDINDIKTVLQEQFDYIQKFGKMPFPPVSKDYDKLRKLYSDILGCNKVMMEIVNGPIGGIEKLLERTK